MVQRIRNRDCSFKVIQKFTVFNRPKWSAVHFLTKLGRKLKPIVRDTKFSSKFFQPVHNSETKVSSLVPQLLGIKQGLIFRVAERCFTVLNDLSSALCIVEFQQTISGRYVQCSRLKSWIHFGVIALLNLSMFHKVFVTAKRVLFEELDVTTFMCISTSLAYVGPWFLSLAIMCKPKETRDTLNAWPTILSGLEARCKRRNRKAQFEDLSLALKLIALFTVVVAVALIMALISIIFVDLPVCLLPLAKTAGIVKDDGTLPHFVWQLIFFPLELALVTPLVVAAGMSVAIAFISVGVLKIHLDEIR